MSGDSGRAQDKGPRERAGRPDHHDPTAGVGGAPSARSALTLRLLLAVFGLVVCGFAAAWLAAVGAPILIVAVLVLLAAVALIDIAVVTRRKARGEPS